MRALALIDSVDYPSAMREALMQLDYNVVGAVWVGGGDRLHVELECGIPLYESLEEALVRSRAKVVVDLSDAPVAGKRGRFWFASRVLAAGLA